MHREFSMTPSGYRKNVIYCRIYIWEGAIRMIHRVNALRPPLKGQTHLRIISSCLRRFFEVIVLSAFLILWLSMVVFLKKPVVLPTVNEAGSFSVQYIFPLLVSLFIQTILWLLLTLFKKSAPELNAKKIMLSLFYIPFIFVTLFLHFNFKSWMPLIHPVTYDSLYYRIDHITPVASAVSLLGKMIDFNQSGAFLYFFLFFSMFVISFVAHSIFDTLANFRKVVVGTCLILLLGGVSYWIAPAVGPFIFEPSRLSEFSAVQNGMYAAYLEILKTGKIPGGYFGEAPAAMPSLHIANSLFFLLSAKRSLPRLAFAYLPVFLFIVIIASASKWHYLIDLVFGAVLSVFVYWLVNKIYG